MRSITSQMRSGKAEVMKGHRESDSHKENGLVSILRSGFPRIAEAALVPTAIFSVTSTCVGLRAAIAISLVYAYGLALHQHRTKGGTAGMLRITCLLLTIRAIASIVINSGRLYFGVPVIETVAVGAMFIATLWSSSPLIVKLASDLVPKVAERLTDHEHHRLAVELSVIWSVVHLGIAMTTLWLLTHEAVSTFVWIKILNGWFWMGLGGAATYIVSHDTLPTVIADPIPVHQTA